MLVRGRNAEPVVISNSRVNGMNPPARSRPVLAVGAAAAVAGRI